MTLSGTAGVGKTALAVHWAHRVADRFPDGQLYVNLRGFDPTGHGGGRRPRRSAASSTRSACRPSGSRPTWTPRSGCTAACSPAGGCWCVLDNARDADQVRPLLPGAPGCLVVVTSRNQLTGLVAADGRPPARASTCSPPPRPGELLARRLGADRVAAEPAGGRRDHRRGARGCRWRWPSSPPGPPTSPAFPLAALAAELRDADGRLDALDGGDAASRRAGGVLLVVPRAEPRRRPGCSGCSACTPARTSRLAAAASLAGLPAGQVRPLLAELARAHLLAEHAPGRYACHDLLRAYAAELADATTADAGPRRGRCAGCSTTTCTPRTPAALLLHPSRDPITARRRPQPGRRPGAARRPRTGAGLVRPPSTRCCWPPSRRAGAPGSTRHAWQLAWTLTTFLRPARALARPGRRPAGRAGRAPAGWPTRPAQAHAHRDLAPALRPAGPARRGRRPPAGRPWSCTRELGDHGRPGAHPPQPRPALSDAAGPATPRRSSTPGRPSTCTGPPATGAGQASALNAVGWYHALLGDHEQALDLLPSRRSPLHRTLGDRNGEAAHLGQPRLRPPPPRPHHRAAIRCYQRALGLFRRLGDRYDEADTLSRLGDTQHAAGGPRPAPCVPGGRPWTSSTTSATRTPTGRAADLVGPRTGSRAGDAGHTGGG